MTEVILDKATAAKDTAVTVTRNIIEFIQASSLVIVAGYGAYAVKTVLVTGIATYVIGIAAAIIAVRGCYELLRAFNKR